MHLNLTCRSTKIQETGFFVLGNFTESGVQSISQPINQYVVNDGRLNQFLITQTLESPVDVGVGCSR